MKERGGTVKKPSSEASRAVDWEGERETAAFLASPSLACSLAAGFARHSKWRALPASYCLSQASPSACFARRFFSPFSPTTEPGPKLYFQILHLSRFVEPVTASAGRIQTVSPNPHLFYLHPYSTSATQKMLNLR